MTVALLVQIDKLVMLIESPVFTCKLDLRVSRRILSDRCAFYSFAFAVARTGKIPLLVQVFVWLTYAPATKQCICIA